ncbi:MAG: hypothetical protein ACJKTH_03230 [Patescibacteria group bacterium UBA2163]
MNWIKKFVAYYKDNPEEYWFKRKVFGWGWTPVTWQGWLVVLAAVAVLVLAAQFLLVEEKVLEYFAILIVMVAIIIAIGYWKGEPPKWQWGFPKDKDTSQ